jgi:hypothetical protein
MEQITRQHVQAMLREAEQAILDEQAQTFADLAHVADALRPAPAPTWQLALCVMIGMGLVALGEALMIAGGGTWQVLGGAVAVVFGVCSVLWSALDARIEVGR